MAGYFMARGPGFKKNYRVPPFKNIDLYHLFCAILQISPAKNNGSFHNIEPILVLPAEEGENNILSLLFVFGKKNYLIYIQLKKRLAGLFF